MLFSSMAQSLNGRDAPRKFGRPAAAEQNGEQGKKRRSKENERLKGNLSRESGGSPCTAGCNAHRKGNHAEAGQRPGGKPGRNPNGCKKERLPAHNAAELLLLRAERLEQTVKPDVMVLEYK